MFPCLILFNENCSSCVHVYTHIFSHIFPITFIQQITFEWDSESGLVVAKSTWPFCTHLRYAKIF